MPSTPSRRKASGAYYTPDDVAASLVSWAVHDLSDQLLDPSCGDGRFLAQHLRSTGVEQDDEAASVARQRAPHAKVQSAEFFEWAASTRARFDCVSGNPPFIRYQTFKGSVRARALKMCAHHGVSLSGLASSWVPFLVVAATLLKPGGRLAFVVPAEIGHAPYAAPLLDFLCKQFACVQVVAIREKLFPDLSEDCWLLYAAGFGASTSEIRFSAVPRFDPSRAPPVTFQSIAVSEWRSTWNHRLRPFFLPKQIRELYSSIAMDPTTQRLDDLASVGIGYVSGANDFFHLSVSDAARLRIPSPLLHPTVRNGRKLRKTTLTKATVQKWHQDDEACLLLKLPKVGDVSIHVRRYLESERGRAAQTAYKCQTREPWYSVPDVTVPRMFLSYMSGTKPNLVLNEANCTCTNSVLAVDVRPGESPRALLRAWQTPYVTLSCEIEGHPLGGGMLKLEPKEAGRVVIPGRPTAREIDVGAVVAATAMLREWRHYKEPA